ncbi:MAG TPA: DUF459 domain-containing protein [Xanthobacteraceae bacterium]|nr:DUF459 domain-containing protein [Xanthobacteraceae bacterium]
MIRTSFLAFLLGAAVLAGFANDASAQRDDRFFFLRDPFRRERSLFNFPNFEAPRKVIADPQPSDEPTGLVYGSSAEADAKRLIPATEYILVFGDVMADQIAQGLADAFVNDRPEVAVSRKTKANSGFVRGDFYDWVGLAPSLLAKEKVTAIVVMLGVNDRQPLRDDQGLWEYHTDRWRELYGKRVEDFLVKLKDKNVPIFLVGMPSMANPKLSTDVVYINEILAERTRKVGGFYVDVWDGFVNETGDFMASGPALDGQIRRLRAADGIHFTKPGQRKLAHYVERELIRLFDSHGGAPPPVPRDTTPEETPPQVSVPPGQTPAPAARPVAGPVLSLGLPAATPGPLAGAQPAGPAPAKPSLDPLAARTLVEGIPAAPVSGRADDFHWPQDASTPQVQQPVTGRNAPAKAGVPY